MADNIIADAQSRPGSAAVEQVARHTVRVRHLRLVVPALAVGLVITYAMSATPPRVDREFLSQFSSIEETEEGVRLAQPRYTGEDLDGLPFEVAANTAIRAQNDPDRVGLDLPEARRVRADGQTTFVRARDGLYDQVGKIVDLENQVELEQQGASGSFLLKTDRAELDLGRQVVTSKAEVTGEGDAGTVRANRATLYQDDNRLVLEGNVKITLEPQSAEAEDAETEQNR